LCFAVAGAAITALTEEEHEVLIKDLYETDFSPSLTVTERQSYYRSSFDSAALQSKVERLLSAEALVPVFPNWWFAFPAVLKGWFDRVLAPSITYDHTSNFGPTKPRLRNLRRALAITSLGSPWRVDRLIIWQPMKRILSTAHFGTCAPACRFEMISLYKADNLNATEVKSFNSRVQ